MKKRKNETYQDKFTINQLLSEDDKLNDIVDYITITYLAITLTSLQVAIKNKEIAKIAIIIPIITALIVAIMGSIIILIKGK